MNSRVKVTVNRRRRHAGRQERRWIAETYLRHHEVSKLQLGSGRHALEGWFNTDVVPQPSNIHFLDSTRPFDLPDTSFDYVLSEHHIEHISYLDGQRMLRECFRILRPGGILRMATPNLEVIAALMARRLGPVQRRYVRFMSDNYIDAALPGGPASVVNNAFTSWGHQFLYDCTTLTTSLRGAGFTGATVTAPGESRYDHLRGVERHGQFIGDEEMNQFETMVVEAQRPRPAAVFAHRRRG